ncbi:MAG: hypothetical protein WC785_02130 [Tatlockia sp.]|jgi:hypothetical protein
MFFFPDKTPVLQLDILKTHRKIGDRHYVTINGDPTMVFDKDQIYQKPLYHKNHPIRDRSVLLTHKEIDNKHYVTINQVKTEVFTKKNTVKTERISKNQSNTQFFTSPPKKKATRKRLCSKIIHFPKNLKKDENASPASQEFKNERPPATSLCFFDNKPLHQESADKDCSPVLGKRSFEEFLAPIPDDAIDAIDAIDAAILQLLSQEPEQEEISYFADSLPDPFNPF